MLPKESAGPLNPNAWTSGQNPPQTSSPVSPLRKPVGKITKRHFNQSDCLLFSMQRLVCSQPGSPKTELWRSENSLGPKGPWAWAWVALLEAEQRCFQLALRPVTQPLETKQVQKMRHAHPYPVVLKLPFWHWPAWGSHMRELLIFIS